MSGTAFPEHAPSPVLTAWVCYVNGEIVVSVIWAERPSDAALEVASHCDAGDIISVTYSDTVKLDYITLSTRACAAGWPKIARIRMP